MNSARRETSRPLPLLCSPPNHDAERMGAAMNFLDDLRAEWIAIRKSLGHHIAGNKFIRSTKTRMKQRLISWNG